MKKILVFTGAGMSQDSGIATFRDAAGLWAQHRVEDVCSPTALKNNRRGVTDFYNMRRKELLRCQPNAGHLALVELEPYYDVQIVTQNIDDLHERAGSSQVLHLHGELRKLRSSKNSDLIVPIEGWEQDIDARAADGALLRPFVVFFGEDVPMYERAVSMAEQADILIIVGTSLAVSPASFVVSYIRSDIPVWMVDPHPPERYNLFNRVTHIEEHSAVGLPPLVASLIQQAQSES